MEQNGEFWLLVTYGLIGTVAFLWGKHSASQASGLDTTGRVMGSVGSIVVIWLLTRPAGELGLIGGLVVAIAAWAAGIRQDRPKPEPVAAPRPLTPAERAQAQRIDNVISELTTNGVAEGLTLKDAELLQGLAARQGIQTAISRTATDHYGGAHDKYKVRCVETAVVRRDELR